MCKPEDVHSWRDFAGRYGWRAYALPILVVVTVVALLTVKPTGTSGDAVGPFGQIGRASCRERV